MSEPVGSAGLGRRFELPMSGRLSVPYLYGWVDQMRQFLEAGSSMTLTAEDLPEISEIALRLRRAYRTD